MKEIWRDIKGYEGLYQISSYGRVKSLERTVWNGKGYYKKSEKIRKGYDNGDGYLYVNLCKEGKRKQYRINRLVAMAFIPNPNNLPEVNHKDKIRTNNNIENLEWCTKQYNVEYSLAKAVIGINKVSGLILEFPSQMEASRQTGTNQGHIWGCCNGRRKSAGGFLWFYADDPDQPDKSKIILTIQN